MNYVKANPIKPEEETKNNQIFKTYMTAYELNRGALSSSVAYVPELYFSEAGLLDTYKKYVSAAAAGNSTL